MFVKAEWLSVGKKWGLVPPRVKRAGKQEFVIPDIVCMKVLPSAGISIQDMLDFSLPIHTIPVKTVDAVSFFSHTAPDPVSEPLLTCLRQLPTPPVLVVQRLVELRHQAWLDGYQSVRYIHLGDAATTHFPLWVVSYWETVLDLRKMVHKPWMDAKGWLTMEV